MRSRCCNQPVTTASAGCEAYYYCKRCNRPCHTIWRVETPQPESIVDPIIFVDNLPNPIFTIAGILTDDTSNDTTDYCTGYTSDTGCDSTSDSGGCSTDC